MLLLDPNWTRRKVKSPRGYMKRWLIVTIIAVLLTGGGATGYYLWHKNSTPNSLASTNPQSQHNYLAVRISETDYSLKLPEGWHKDSSPHPNPAQTIYRDKKGTDMFSVFNSDADTTGVSTYDLIWTVSADNSGLVVNGRSPNCKNLPTEKLDGSTVVSFNGIAFYCDQNPEELHIGIYGSAPSRTVELGGNQFNFLLYSSNSSFNYQTFLDEVLKSFTVM